MREKGKVTQEVVGVVQDKLKYIIYVYQGRMFGLCFGRDTGRDFVSFSPVPIVDGVLEYWYWK